MGVAGALARHPGPAAAFTLDDGRTLVCRPQATLRLALGPDSRPAWAWLDPRTGETLPAPISLEGEPASVFDRVLRAFRPSTSKGDDRSSGFVGMVTHDAASIFEPSARSRRRPPLPLIELHRFEEADILPPGAGEQDVRPPLPPIRLRSQTGRLGYLARVRMALDFIRAGDVYQVNIGHRLTGPFRGSPRALFAHLSAQNQPKHGGYYEFAPGAGARAVASLSPELFLTLDAGSRRVVTRPMKGTRTAGGDTELRDSPKDRAELNMIVDLMRNDLGRVCEFGSIAVDEPRNIERHAAGALVQATATVSGTLREACGQADLLAATFPPGSVTGAPKLRALQLIDELEDFPRGAWCGSLGVFFDDGSAQLNVAIRTATLTAARLDYPVGAGIVADSDPESEWRETLAKAEPIRAVATIEDDR